jgi:hypothetical protein
MRIYHYKTISMFGNVTEYSLAPLLRRALNDGGFGFVASIS